MRDGRPGPAAGRARLRPPPGRTSRRRIRAAGKPEEEMGIKQAMTAAVLALVITAPARAETTEVTIAQQFGVSFLPLMMMEHDGSVERHARALGVTNLKTNW